MQKYGTSFTVGGGFCNESLLLAELFLELRDWEAVKKHVEGGNLLQARTKSTAGRVFREISSRLKLLEDIELRVLLKGTPQERNQIIWLSICKRHPFIRDFAVEVIQEKHQSLKKELFLEDFDNFFQAKAEWHEELERLQHPTRLKLRRTAFKMMRDVGIVSEDNQIIPVVMSPVVLKTIREHSAEYLNIYPMA